MFSFAIISGANIVYDPIYLTVHVCVLFQGHQRMRQEQLAFVMYIDIVKPLHSTEDLILILDLRWSIKEKVNFTNLQLVLKLEVPRASCYDILYFESTKHNRP